MGIKPGAAQHYAFCLHRRAARRMTALLAINTIADNGISHDFCVCVCVLSLSPHACYALIPSEFLVAGGGVRWGGVWGGERRGSDLALEGILVSHPLWYAKLTSGFWKDSLYTHTVRRLMFLHTPQPHPHHQISARAAYRQTLLLALGMCSDTLSALTQHHLVRSLKASLVFPLSRRLSVFLSIIFFSGGAQVFFQMDSQKMSDM